MALQGRDLDWRLCGATSGGGSPAIASYADWWSSTTLYEYQSVTTSAQSGLGERHVIIDSSRSGDGLNVHRGKWVNLIEGVLSPYACGRVVESNGARIVLDRPFSATLASGIAYRMWPKHNIFDLVTPEECASGVTDFRVVDFFNNGSLAALADVRAYCYPLDDAKDVALEINIQDANVAGDSRLDPALISSGDVDIFNAHGMVLDAYKKGGTDPWDSAPPVRRWWTSGCQAKTTSLIVMTNNEHRCLVLRRTVLPQSERRRSVAFLLVITNLTTGCDPNPFHSAAVIVFDLEGRTPSPSIWAERAIPQPGGDPFVHIGGGSRFLANLVDTETEQAISERDVSFTLTGQGSLSTIDDEPQTDEDGDVFCTLTSPTDDGYAGTSATVEVAVGDGEEV